MRVPALALALLVSAAASAAGGEISVRADAGLGGVARPGRWMPIVVSIENHGTAIEAAVSVTIEQARVTRMVPLAAPSRKRVEIFMRAPDTDAAVAHVEVRAGDRVVASTRAPLRIVSGDAPFVLCVSVQGVAPGATCTATVDAAALPSASRGYSAVDAVAWPDGASTTALDEPQRQAYLRAEAVRTWNGSTAMAVSWPAMPDAGGQTATRSGALVIYTAFLLLGALGLSRIARRPALSYAAAGLLVAGGTAAVLADGRLGTALEIREVTVIRAGAYDGAEVHVRATAVPSAAGAITLRTSLQDVELAEDTLDVHQTAAGGTVLSGNAARGREIALALTGFSPSAPMGLRREGETITVENRLPSALTNCTLPDGFQPMSLPRIEPGATAQIAVRLPIEDAALTCAVENPPSHLSLEHGRFSRSGRALLLVDLRSGAAQ